MTDLGLGVVSLVTSLVPIATSVADTLRYISSARFKDADSAAILTTLLLQQSRYYCWFVDMGFESARSEDDLLDELGKGPFSNAPIKRIVLQTLQQSMKELSEIAKLLAKHQIQEGQDATSTVHPLAQARAFVLSNTFWNLREAKIPNNTAASQTKAGSKSTRQWLQIIKSRASWAVVDHDRLTDAITRFRDQIDVLVWICGRTRTTLEAQIAQPSRIVSTLSTDAQYDQLRISVRDPGDPLLAFATFKHNKVNLPREAVRRHLDKNEWKKVTSADTRTLLGIGSLLMYAEWASFPAKHTIDDRPRLIERLDEVAVPLNLLPRSNIFSVLHCSGYDYDWETNKYALIFDTPPTASPTRQPISLADHILATKDKPGRKPDLGGRFELAATLAGILLKMHVADLLHKDFHSRNMVFFPTNATGSPIDLGSPYVVNFQYTRSYYGPSDIILNYGDVGRYRHPLYQGIDESVDSLQRSQNEPREKYRPEFDVYGLGVALLEIAGWEPLDTILGDEGMTSHEVLAKLIKKTKQLSFRVGKVYQGVVERCLTGSYAEDVTGEYGSTGRQEALNEALFWHVYRPLRSCAA